MAAIAFPIALNYILKVLSVASKCRKKLILIFNLLPLLNVSCYRNVHWRYELIIMVGYDFTKRMGGGVDKSGLFRRDFQFSLRVIGKYPQILTEYTGK